MTHQCGGALREIQNLGRSISTRAIDKIISMKNSTFAIHTKYDMYRFINARAAAANFWQARPPQWRPHQGRAAVAAAAFYFAKSRQGLSLGGLASRGSPERNMIRIARLLT